MPLFTYKAIREDGTTVTDETMAADAAELQQDLEGRGYLVLNLKQKNKSGAGGDSGSAKDFLIFNQEFTTLIKAGLPILQALELLHKRAEKQGFQRVLAGIIQEIKGGKASPRPWQATLGTSRRSTPPRCAREKRAAPSWTCSGVS